MGLVGQLLEPLLFKYWDKDFYCQATFIVVTEQLILNLHYQISEYEAMFDFSNKNNFYSFQLVSQHVHQVQKF